MEKKNIIAFDFDGTLVDSTRLIHETLINTSHEYGHNEITEENIEEHFGPTESGILKEIVGPKVFPEAWAYYIEDYIRLQPEILHNFPEMDELLEELSKRKDILLLLITGRSRPTAEISLSYLGYDKYFAKIYTGSEEGINKDENINAALEDYGIEKSRILYIGDTLADIHTMKSIDVDLLSVTYSSKDTETIHLIEKENPSNVCHTIQELKNRLFELI
jgi:phosphoglycolate phosphatase